VVTIWPTSIFVTRVIGRKMRRRAPTSTTRPTSRGGIVPYCINITKSRTLPSCSPLGSNTADPRSRAM
jgi:hypothetical protein